MCETTGRFGEYRFYVPGTNSGKTQSDVNERPRPICDRKQNDGLRGTEEVLIDFEWNRVELQSADYLLGGLPRNCNPGGLPS